MTTSKLIGVIAGVPSLLLFSIPPPPPPPPFMPATQASDGNKIGDFMLYRQKVVLFDSGSFFFAGKKRDYGRTSAATG